MAKVFAAIAVLALIGVGGFFLVQKSKAQGAAQQEIALQQSEKQECQKRLALFYQAWKKYKADHKGVDPSGIEVLIPKYIPDVKLMICPTAQRWIDNKQGMDSGTLRMNNKEYRETYGFRWLGSGAPLALKKQGEKAPLVVCTAHEEGLYLAVYHKKPKLDAFDAENRGQYVSDLQNAHPLVVRRNGTVEELTAAEE